eukprot:11671332-Prorocentrum_lima.AAC.1
MSPGPLHTHTTEGSTKNPISNPNHCRHACRCHSRCNVTSRPSSAARPPLGWRHHAVVGGR